MGGGKETEIIVSTNLLYVLVSVQKFASDRLDKPAFLNTLSQPGYRFLHWDGTGKALKAGKNHMGTCVISKMVFHKCVLPTA